MADTFERTNTSTAFETTDVVKTIGGNEILHGVTLAVRAHELTLIAGESGSGKSTLLSCVGGLDTITDGEVSYGSLNIGDLSPDARARWRGQNLGFVFQDAHLINGLDAGENIVAPYELAGISLDYARIARICKALKIHSKLSQNPRTLSGGEKQRVAIARALAHNPSVLFADEPTAALDVESKHNIHRILRNICNIGTTVVLVSHDKVSRGYADRMVTLADGQIVQDLRAQ